MGRPLKNLVFIAWIRFQQRSELLAQQLHAKMHFVYRGRRGGRSNLAVRYLRQTATTWRILQNERPRIVLVQNPPIFCVLLIFVYARFYGARYVIDSHTGAFFRPWKWFAPLHRFLSRRAITTIVHNESQENVVKKWRCNSFVLGDYVGERSIGCGFPLDAPSNVAVVGSFSRDEPLAEVFEAAARLPNVRFYFTGDDARLSNGLRDKLPPNCRLTGYLRYEQYLSLLRHVEVVIALTTRNHTLLSGAYEAVSLGTPLITSNWPVLRRRFSYGVLHVPNTPDGISGGVRHALARTESLKQGMVKLRTILQQEWENKLSDLCALIGEDSLRRTPPPFLT